MKINVYGASSVGKVRKLNEDSFSFDSSRGDKGSIFLVCDGMGGHKAGEVASQYTSIKVVEYFYKSLQKDIPSKLNESIRKVNNEIYNLSQKDSSKHGMGTTLVAMVLFERTLYFANVGDSRAYLLRNNSIRQLTKDHSWLQEKISEGALSPSEARNNPNKNIITKCVGYDSDVEPDIGSIVLKEGDRLILCSDGLWDELNDFKIKNAALYNSDLKKSVERLIFEAEENGGKDNVTVVGMDYGKVKINVINKNKNLIMLGAISILAILLLVCSIVIFYFYNNAKTERENYKNIFAESVFSLVREYRALTEFIFNLANANKKLTDDNNRLKEENETLTSSNIEAEHNLKKTGDTTQINTEENSKLIINQISNLTEQYTDLENVKSFFIYKGNLSFLVSRKNLNELYFLSINLEEKISIPTYPIKFIFPDNEESLGIDELIFDNSSDNFYLISGNAVYNGKKELLFSSNGVVDVKNVSGFFSVISGDELSKYLIIDNDLYYFKYHNDSKNVEFYKISNSDLLGNSGEMHVEVPDLNFSSIDLSFDIQNKKLFILLINDNENYLCTFDKIDGRFENPKVLLIESNYQLPYKILINDSQSNGVVLIYFKDNILISYNENLELLNHYSIANPDESADLEIKDVFVNGGKLYLMDNSNNIYSTVLGNN